VTSRRYAVSASVFVALGVLMLSACGGEKPSGLPVFTPSPSPSSLTTTSKWSPEQQQVIDGYERFTDLSNAIWTKAEMLDMAKVHLVAQEPFATDAMKVITNTLSTGYVQRGKSVSTILAVRVTGDTEWRERGMPVYATRFINYPNSPYERLTHWTKCTTSPEIDIVDELEHHLGSGVCVVEKSVYSFFTPKWSEQAKSAQWSDVVIVGIDTDGCVLKTALDAFELDLTPWVVTDATASHSGKRAYDAALYIAGRTIGSGQLVDVERVISALPSGAAA
jgi:nicotinamidase-related amidase